MACMYLLFGVVVVDNWYLHKIQNRYPQHYPTYHLVYQGSGMAKFEKYSQRGLVFFSRLAHYKYLPTYFSPKFKFFFFSPRWKKKLSLFYWNLRAQLLTSFTFFAKMDLLAQKERLLDLFDDQVI